MKKVFTLSVIAMLGITACNKDNETGVPPIITPEIVTPTLETIDAATSNTSVYVVNKKVILKGNIVVQNAKSYFRFQDGTLIQIYSRNFNNLPAEVKTKLATEGQEISVTGTFTDFTPVSGGATIKEIVYNNENDLVFGVTPTVTITELNAATSTSADYIVGKNVKLKGNIVVQNAKSYFRFQDGTLVQIYSRNFNNLPAEVKTKLATEGQEVSVTGTFTDFMPASGGATIKEIVYNGENDLIFGATPNTSTPPTTSTLLFDFETISTGSGPGYDKTGELTASDGTILSYKARTELDSYAISGKGLMLNKTNSNPFIKITFKSGVREIKLKYKAAFNNAQKRKLVIYEEDETTIMRTEEIENNTSGELVMQVNKTSDFTIFIKSTQRQIVIDDISWSY